MARWPTTDMFTPQAEPRRSATYLQYFGAREIQSHGVVPTRHVGRQFGIFPVAAAELNGDSTT
jgi:hypothetical protein